MGLRAAATTINQTLERDVSSVGRWFGLIHLAWKFLLSNMFTIYIVYSMLSSLSDILWRNLGARRWGCLQCFILETHIGAIKILINSISDPFWTWISYRLFSIGTVSFGNWIFRIILLMIPCSILLLGVHFVARNNFCLMNFIRIVLLLICFLLNTINLRRLG